MISSARYFLYREAPFRILHMHDKGFQAPSTSNEGPKLFVWWFLNLDAAKAVAKSCSAVAPTYVAEKADLKKRVGGFIDQRLVPAYKRIPDAVVRPPKPPKDSLESLA